MNVLKSVAALPAELLAEPLAILRAAWRRLRAWRRIRFTVGGAVFTAGAFAIGFAAVNTGNNLLHLLLGAMLGFIALSGWLSEQALRGLEVRRRTPQGVTVGKTFRISYHVTSRKRWIPTLAVHLLESGLPGAAFIARLDPGESVTVRSENHFIRRGIYPLETLTLSTEFPFGLFTSERDIPLTGELVIWPRADRSVALPTPPGGRNMPRYSDANGVTLGARGEFRGLREYRAGDDPRDIHWRSTARTGQPMVREYDQDSAETLWICLDTRDEPGDHAEGAVETAASLAARAYHDGRRFALVTPSGQVDAGTGSAQLERLLDVLARVDFQQSGPRLSPPADPARCVLVSMSGSGRSSYGAYVPAGRWADNSTSEDAVGQDSLAG
jgi:uncharacterized protein (DUF58 family)